MKNDNDVCPICGKKLVEFKFVKDLKKGSRVCPIGLGSCDVSVADCSPEVVEDGSFISCKCPHLRVSEHERSECETD